jgi:predicted transcriptional regulator
MPKRKNPETSTDAYRSLDPKKLNKTYNDILLALAAITEGTFEDIAAQMNVKESVVWKRLSELRDNHLIYRPGNRRPLKSGALGYTWMLVTKGKAPQKISERSLPGKTVSDFSKKIKQLSLL